MKNLLLPLKQSGHQKALLTVLIVIMFATLFLLLASLGVPAPSQDEIEPTEEVTVALDFYEVAEGDPINNTIEQNSDLQATDNEVAVLQEMSEISASETTVKLDESLIFGIGENGIGKNNSTNFGDKEGVENAQVEVKDLDRTIIKHPNFKVNASEEGTIAVHIWVDQNGDVARTAYDGSNSNSGSQYLINKALTAAKTMKYSERKGVHNTYVGIKRFTFKKQ